MASSFFSQIDPLIPTWKPSQSYDVYVYVRVFYASFLEMMLLATF